MIHKTYLWLAFLSLLVTWFAGEPPKLPTQYDRPASQAGNFLPDAPLLQEANSTPEPATETTPTTARVRRSTPTPALPATSPHHPGLIAGGILVLVVILIGLFRITRMQTR